MICKQAIKSMSSPLMANCGNEHKACACGPSSTITEIYKTKPRVCRASQKQRKECESVFLSVCFSHEFMHKGSMQITSNS